MTTPRNFAIDPTGVYCIVADQDSSDIRLYSINQDTGLLTYKNQIITSVSQPVCIVPFIWEPPQPVLSILFTPSNNLSLSIGNSSSFFTYQLYESTSLSATTVWNLAATGTQGQTNFLTIPTDMGLIGATGISSGGGFQCAALSAGGAKCWGYGFESELGANANFAGTPVATGISGTVSKIRSGDNHTCVLLSTGVVQCWGVNQYHQLGQNAGSAFATSAAP